LRLTDLNPQWLEKDGQRVGVLFMCPCCQQAWLTCFWVKLPTWGEEGHSGEWTGQMGCVRRAFKKAKLYRTKRRPNGWRESNTVPCDETCQWKWNGKDFDAMTITPSLDASKSGHWHGFITAGAIQ